MRYCACTRPWATRSSSSPSRVRVGEGRSDRNRRRGHPCRGLVATVFALKLYAEKYKAVVMYGDTKMIERNTAIQAFKTPNSGASSLSR